MGESTSNNVTRTEDKSEKIFDIRERAFAFAVRIVKLCRFLEKHSDVSKSLINQLLDAGTSVGANLEESVAGQSKADFIHKNAISLKEARESNYWLRLILASYKFDDTVQNGIQELTAEALEIANILGTIIVKQRSKIFTFFTFYFLLYSFRHSGSSLFSLTFAT